MRTYCKKLSAFGSSRCVKDINHLSNQLTLEVITKTVFGDQSFNLLDVNGAHLLFDALLKIGMQKIF